jgi:thiol:disulfide interchange protein DsbC
MCQNSPITQSVQTMNFSRIALLCAVFASTQACAQSTTPAPSAKPSQPAVAKPSANEAAVRASLGKLAPGIKITAIKPSPLSGLSEVIVDGQVLYVSNDGKYLIQGAIIDTATRTNLTEISEANVRRVLLASVPATQKISFAPANPKFRVTVFTDIDCGYCRKMHTQIDEYNRLGIAIDYLFFPRAGIGSESAQKAINIWCAPDRKLAMTSAKNGKTLPDKNCPNFVADDYAIGRKAGVDGTPAVYATTGMQLGGYLSPKDLLKALNKLDN